MLEQASNNDSYTATAQWFDQSAAYLQKSIKHPIKTMDVLIPTVSTQLGSRLQQVFTGSMSCSMSSKASRGPTAKVQNQSLVGDVGQRGICSNHVVD